MCFLEQLICGPPSCFPVLLTSHSGPHPADMGTPSGCSNGVGKCSLFRVSPFLVLNPSCSFRYWHTLPTSPGLAPRYPSLLKICPISIIKPYLNPLSKSRASVCIAPCVMTFPAYRSKFKCHPKLQSTGVWGVIQTWLKSHGYRVICPLASLPLLNLFPS